MALRRLIFKTAAAVDGVGEIEEMLKWGEPAYVTAQSGAGSTIRIGWKKSRPSQYALYVNCQTTLIDSYRSMYPREFKFEGNRAIVFEESGVVPAGQLSSCIELALTYHLKR